MLMFDLKISGIENFYYFVHDESGYLGNDNSEALLFNL